MYLGFFLVCLFRCLVVRVENTMLSMHETEQGIGHDALWVVHDSIEAPLYFLTRS